ncbi:MAG: SEC-C metal-binding domain-containing protein [Campylobacterota bacterium]|nr:SEC-C metal-binding domain-containing protein [Campylobacterota bacterium]
MSALQFKKEIEKFDKLLNKKSNQKLDTFDEIVDMILNLIKLEVNSTQNELMQRISNSYVFNSTDELQKFLNGYFTFNNYFIEELDRIEYIENDNVFDDEIDKFVKIILEKISSDNLQEVLLEFIFKIVTTVMDEYPVKLLDDADENLKNLTKIFSSEEIAELFVGVNVIATFLTEQKNIKKDELIDMSKSVFIFCMAMNNLRKENYENTQNQQISSANAVNTVDYNVGRNDPCPCGSGRKYKKCCLNKNKPKLAQSIEFQEPKALQKELTKTEIHELYQIWSRFLNFVSKAFAGAAGEEYIKIYEKNSAGEYFLTDEVVKGSRHYLTIRNFLNEYFFMLLEHFIDDNKVSQKNIAILTEIRDTYKYAKHISFEMFKNGNAIFYNLDKQDCFYAYQTFYPYSKVFPRNEIFETMFFSYKGRIISDGVATKPNIDLGQNMLSMMRDDYKKDRENMSFNLKINEQPQRNIYQLKISIKGAKPPIWRRVLVKPNTSFYGLHDVIQSIFDWEDYHMFMFYAKDRRYTSSEMIEESMFGDACELVASQYTISEELENEKDKIKYIYDFGDSWEHQIVLEKILPFDENVSYPSCIGGRRRGPLEDSGGIYNYNDIADAIENPTVENQYVLGEDNEEYYAEIYPAEFNKELANIILKREY